MTFYIEKPRWIDTTGLCLVASVLSCLYISPTFAGLVSKGSSGKALISKWASEEPTTTTIVFLLVAWVAAQVVYKSLSFHTSLWWKAFPWIVKYFLERIIINRLMTEGFNLHFPPACVYARAARASSGTTSGCGQEWAPPMSYQLLYWTHSSGRKANALNYPQQLKC